MKLAIPHAALAVFTAVALLIPAASPAIGADAATDSPAATILDVDGPVTWHAKAETAFRPATGGEKLYAGAIVRTGAKAHAHLVWRNGGDFKLLPLSELAVPDEDGVLINAGKVWAQFKEKLHGPFFFKSPTATAVIRGTTLGVEIAPDGGTTVAVVEGRVEVSSAHGGPPRMLEPGQSLTVSPFGVMGPIQPVEPQLPSFERSMSQTAPLSNQGPGPGRPNEPRMGMGDWLQRNRASDRLESVRQQERARVRPNAPDGGMRDGGNRELPPPGREMPRGEGGRENPNNRMPNQQGFDHRRGGELRRPEGPQAAVNPDRAFPAGRPPLGAFQAGPGAVCPPPDPTMTGTAVLCTPPPPPPDAVTPVVPAPRP
jgi:hypothetical protein